MVNGAGIEDYIQHGKEERYLEYKGSMVWTNDDTKVKIAQAMMAMSNLRNGGVIVVGIKETKRGVWEPDVMTDEQVASFTQDDIAQWVNDYAVPAVQFTVEPFLLDTNKFVIIKVRSRKDLYHVSGGCENVQAPVRMRSFVHLLFGSDPLQQG